MTDFNQILVDMDLVPPIVHKTLTLLTDPGRLGQKRGPKKPIRGTPPGRTHGEHTKLQPFEAPIFEQFEGMKKYVSDAAVIYVRLTPPVSTRAAKRPGKDKNPFAVNKISPLEDVAQFAPSRLSI
jgi:hypothetical protein